MQATETAAEWGVAPLGLLIDHLLATHHTFTKVQLERVARLTGAAVLADGGRHAELDEIRDVLDELREELWRHLAREEEVLFPLIRALERGRGHHGLSPAWPIEVLELEHSHALYMLDRLRDLTHDYQAPTIATPEHRALYDALASLDADLETHIMLENDVLHPRALDLAP